MTGKKVLFKNIFSLGIVQISNIVFPLITLPVIARIIGPDKFGIINYAAAIVAFFSLIINYSFDMTATRLVAQNRDNPRVVNAIFSNILYTKILLLLVSLLVFTALFFFIPSLQKEKLIAVYTFIVCIAWVLTPNWLYQGMQDLNRIAIFNFFSKLIFTVVVLVLIKHKEDYVLQPLIFSFSQIIVAVASFIWGLRLYDIKLIEFSWSNVFATLKDGRMVFFSLVAGSLYIYTNVIILGLYTNPVEIGYYTAANKLISVAMLVLSAPVGQALYPYIGTAFGKSEEDGLNTIRRVFPISILFSFLYSFFIFLFSPLIVHVMFGYAFGPTVNLLRILSFVPLIMNCSSFIGIHTMINLKMDKQYLIVIFIGSLVSIPLNLILAYYFGGFGTAISWITTEAFVCLLFFIALKKYRINLIEKQYFNFSYIYLALTKALPWKIFKVNGDLDLKTKVR